MAIHFECPNCSTNISALDGDAGQEQQCSNCRKAVQVPDPETDRYGRFPCKCGSKVTTWDSLLKDGVVCPACGSIVRMDSEEDGHSEGAADADDAKEPAPVESSENYEIVEEDEPLVKYSDDGEGTAEAPAVKEDIIFCTRCGARNRRLAGRCAECGAMLKGTPKRSQQKMVARTVPTYLVESILVTLFSVCMCIFTPLGVVAIVYAVQVNSHLAAGNYEAASRASQTAKTLCWVTFGCVIGVFVLFFMIGFLGALAG